MVEQRFSTATDADARPETDKRGSPIADITSLERQLAEIVTWDLVHELQAAAALARESGEIDLESRLSNTSTHLAALLSSDARHRMPPDTCTSQYWVG